MTSISPQNSGVITSWKKVESSVKKAVIDSSYVQEAIKTWPGATVYSFKSILNMCLKHITRGCRMCFNTPWT